VHENNSTDDDVERLTAMFNPSVWECTLSVICESDQTIADAVNHNLDMINDFSGRMVANGFNTRVFDPAGQDDIGGGCGQLWQVQQFAEENPHILKQSPGNKILNNNGEDHE
jgi:23S rRNA (adenine2503-C2)-methyltransferase